MIFLKINYKKLIASIAIPLLVGGLSALFTMKAMDDFNSVEKPPLSPPGWLFPIVWTILYILMGVASYFVAVSDKPARSKTALTVYALQLAFNFLWSIIFFSVKAYLFAFVWLVALLILIIVNAVLFYRIDKKSGYLLIPYILWVGFAGYLNFGIYLLN